MEKIDPSLVDNKLIFPDDETLSDDVRLHAAERRAADRVRRRLVRCHRWLRARSAPAADEDVRRASAAQRHQVVRRVHGRRRPRPRRTARVVLRAARPVRLRQDHDAADGRRPRDADRGHDHARRPGHHLRQAVPAAGQHGLPELRAVPAPRHPRERRVRPQAAQVVRRRHPGPRDARAGRARAARRGRSRPSCPAASSSGSRSPGR